jgi:hypothetical protein
MSMCRHTILYRLAFAIILFTLMFQISCLKERELGPGFDMDYVEEFTIPAGIGNFQVHHFYIRDISSRYLAILDQQGKTDADISSILTAEASINGVFSDADYALINQVSLRVFEEGKPDDWVEIAYREPVPTDPGSRLDLIPTLANSKPFFSKTRYSLDVVIWLRGTTQVETQTRLDLKMRATL